MWIAIQKYVLLSNADPKHSKLDWFWRRNTKTHIPTETIMVCFLRGRYTCSCKHLKYINTNYILSIQKFKPLHKISISKWTHHSLIDFVSKKHCSYTEECYNAPNNVLPLIIKRFPKAAVEQNSNATRGSRDTAWGHLRVNFVLKNQIIGFIL